MDRKVIGIKELEKLQIIAQLATLQLFDFGFYIEHLRAISNGQKEVSVELYKKCCLNFPQTMENQQQLIGLLIDLGFLRKNVEEVMVIPDPVEIEYPEASLGKSIPVKEQIKAEETISPKVDNVVNLFSKK